MLDDEVRKQAAGSLDPLADVKDHMVGHKRGLLLTSAAIVGALFIYFLTPYDTGSENYLAEQSTPINYGSMDGAGFEPAASP